MPDILRRSGPPRVLVASHHAGPGTELLRLAQDRDYTVVRAYTGTQALERARDARPDVIILDETLPDLECFDATRALRDDPAVGPSAPILLLTTGRPTATEHFAALRAGIWEFLVHPFNPEEAATKLHGYVLLKLAADRAREASAMQDESGLLTVQGLALRAQELTLQAFHHGAALACVALALTPRPPLRVAERGSEGVRSELVARVLKATGRRSDAFGRLGSGEFAVVALGTDAAGAVCLAERVARALATETAGGDGRALRAGYDAVSNARYTPIEPKNLLARATSALRIAKAAAGADWIHQSKA